MELKLQRYILQFFTPLPPQQGRLRSLLLIHPFHNSSLRLLEYLKRKRSSTLVLTRPGKRRRTHNAEHDHEEILSGNSVGVGLLWKRASCWIQKNSTTNGGVFMSTSFVVAPITMIGLDSKETRV